jgi:N-hydroxyarylamine O-acetyltransferase
MKARRTAPWQAKRVTRQGLDLNRYFERIGYTGPREASGPRAVETLHALSAAHVGTIPFENLDVLLGRPIQLEAEAIFDKLVVRKRGGYCFEQNGLFVDVLRAMGFEAAPLSARVRLRTPSRNEIPTRTHVFVRVVIDDEAWLADVGVGAASLTAPLRFGVDREQRTPHEPRRLIEEDGRHFHQIKYNDAWSDIYEFTGEEMPFVDRVVANWYTSTHPDSRFKNGLVVAKALPEGRRVSLLNRVFTIRESNGVATTTTVENPKMLLDVLRTQFGLSGFDDGDAARIFAVGNPS